MDPAPDIAPRPSTDTAPDPLGELRRELDAIDAILLDALLLRFRCIHRIGAAKGSHSIPVMQPQRVRSVLRRATKFAEEHRLNPTALQDVFAVLITEACRQEESVDRSADPDLARASSWDRVEEIVREIQDRAHSAHR
ncbi:chorismate mutase [Streptomyces sp. WZ.A104]|uniref:chorismate mutase n=1 Tax=Streptomyces sp. WZ.A104 TaxID=2023771 RepID=UPI0015CA4837|nr:chorismate mutase [Streptomyces sp. WZ.A104]